MSWCSADRPSSTACSPEMTSVIGQIHDGKGTRVSMDDGKYYTGGGSEGRKDLARGVCSHYYGCSTLSMRRCSRWPCHRLSQDRDILADFVHLNKGMLQGYEKKTLVRPLEQKRCCTKLESALYLASLDRPQ